ncbi:STM4011 family radical SAM protein [Paenibacillus campi]|uniref:STM4011 family radical SAM protein n=1 Tax=Paenibacillus campi TaxID=3106031 RepID=UPI002B002736|nr:STM4011 family radical SAM protein [Paenibacillus sp. SGZ-1014]
MLNAASNDSRNSSSIPTAVSLYYRGSLSSCNYACPYCPFSKTVDSRETLERDRQQLERFIDWVRAQAGKSYRLSIFFNPYGEALVHGWYRRAMIELSHLPHVDKVAVQTNLSVKLDWTMKLQRDKVAFWATYHPGQTSEAQFVRQCMTLYEQGIDFSAGTVGLRESFAAIAALRKQLPDDVYVWINAFKDRPAYYEPGEVEALERIDPYFRYNLNDYASLGQACLAGQSVFYVQGNGMVKRCYQDKRVIGNIYRHELEQIAAERTCQMKKCGCYIGYIHMPEQPFADQYGQRLLERIPLQYNAHQHEQHR